MSSTAKRTARRARARVLSTEWAIRPETLRSMITVLERRGTDFAAIAKEAGEYKDDTFEARVRDGIAYVPVHGVLARYMSLFTHICGGQSYELLSNDLGTLLADPSVRAIVWEIDSPGGEVNGCSELARLIYESREKKPQIAFISGDGCSAAYWVASACERVYAADTAVIGCLGCQAAWLDDRKHLEDEGYVEISIVSSQTPHKNLDPMTDEGRASVQRVVDALADRFLDAVAQYRGVSRASVLTEFGAGDVFVGDAARVRHMIDGVTTCEALHAQLTAPAGTPGALLTQLGATPMKATMTKKKTRVPAGALTAATDDEEEKEDQEGAAGAGEDDEEEKEDQEGAAGAGEDDEEEDDEEEEEERSPTARVRTVKDLAARYPTLTTALRAAERRRILGILDLTPAGQEQAARAAIEAGTSIGAAARQFLEATGANRDARRASFRAPAFTPPRVEGPAPDETSATTMSDRILAARAAARGVPARN